MRTVQAEYIWLDGAQPTSCLRSKTRFVGWDADYELDIDLSGAAGTEALYWTFDASSTYQAPNDNSDLLLRPVRIVINPRRPDSGRLILCEVFNLDGTPHSSNSRARLRQALEGVAHHEPWIGFEQEYTLYGNGQILGWPGHGTPGNLGPFFCGVGPSVVAGREFAETHANQCLYAGLSIRGINAEDMPGQWEFQVGPHKADVPSVDALTSCDHLWLARWLLFRLGEEYDLSPSLSPKPVLGEWPGSGCHANFSTRTMRNGMKAQAQSELSRAIRALACAHARDIKAYGAGLELRLTGRNHSSQFAKFTWGVADRSASVRIPGRRDGDPPGYLEDRRPAANCDPYLVCTQLIETIFADGGDSPNGEIG